MISIFTRNKTKTLFSEATISWIYLEKLSPFSQFFHCIVVDMGSYFLGKIPGGLTVPSTGPVFLSKTTADSIIAEINLFDR